jgi:PAS domain S-box-containing protein
VRFWRQSYQRALVEVSYTTEYLVAVGSHILQLTFRLMQQNGKIFGISVFGKDITTIRNTEKTLRKSEEKFSKAFLASPGLISIASIEDGTYIDVNDNFLKVTGFGKGEVVGRTPDELNMWLNAEDRKRYIENLSMNGSLRNHEVQYRMKNGEIRSFLVSSEIMQLDEKQCSLNFIFDNTDRKRAEEALKRNNRELAALSRCNQVLVRAENEQSLTDDICRTICEEAGYRMAWVGYAEQNAMKTVRPVSWAGHEQGYLALANILWGNDSERGRGPAGTAIRSGETCVVQAFDTDARVNPWREDALQRGYRSSISLPLKDGDSTFGALTIYSAEPGAFLPGEIRLLEELAEDLAFGIAFLRTRSAHRAAQETLQRNEAKFRALVENGNDGILLLSLERRVIYASPSYTHIIGYSARSSRTRTNPLK